MVLGLLCLALLIMLFLMKTSLGSDDAAYSTSSRVARKLVWTVATSQYMCGCDCVRVRVLFTRTYSNSSYLLFLPSLSLSVRNALVVVAAAFVAFSWNAYGYHVFTITGETSQGLPPFRPPPTTDTTANGTVVSFGEIVEVSS